MVTFVCPECEGSFQVEIDDPSEAEGATMDCRECGLLIVCKDGELKNFHRWLHSQNPRWPEDGKGTGCLELRS